MTSWADRVGFRGGSTVGTRISVNLLCSPVWDTWKWRKRSEEVWVHSIKFMVASQNHPEFSMNFEMIFDGFFDYSHRSLKKCSLRAAFLLRLGHLCRKWAVYSSALSSPRLLLRSVVLKSILLRWDANKLWLVMMPIKSDRCCLLSARISLVFLLFVQIIFEMRHVVSVFHL